MQISEFTRENYVRKYLGKLIAYALNNIQIGLIFAPAYAKYCVSFEKRV